MAYKDPFSILEEDKTKETLEASSIGPSKYKDPFAILDNEEEPQIEEVPAEEKKPISTKRATTQAVVPTTADKADDNWDAMIAAQAKAEANRGWMQTAWDYVGNPGEFNLDDLIQGAKSTGQNVALTKPLLEYSIVAKELTQVKRRHEEISKLRGQTEPGFVARPSQKAIQLEQDLKERAAVIQHRLGIEWLKANPRTQEGWIGDLLRMGPQFAAQIATTVAAGPVAGGLFMGSQIMSATAAEAIQQGHDPERAIMAGATNALISAPMEQLGLGKFAKYLPLRKGIQGKLMTIFGSQGREALTEILQQIPDHAANLFAQNPNLSMLEALDKTLSDPKEVAKLKKEIVQAGFGGFAMGTGSGFIRAVKYNTEQAEDKADDKADKKPDKKEKKPKKKTEEPKKDKKPEEPAKEEPPTPEDTDTDEDIGPAPQEEAAFVAEQEAAAQDEEFDTEDDPYRNRHQNNIDFLTKMGIELTGKETEAEIQELVDQVNELGVFDPDLDNVRNEQAQDVQEYEESKFRKARMKEPDYPKFTYPELNHPVRRFYDEATDTFSYIDASVEGKSDGRVPEWTPTQITEANTKALAEAHTIIEEKAAKQGLDPELGERGFLTPNNTWVSNIDLEIKIGYDSLIEKGNQKRFKRRKDLKDLEADEEQKAKDQKAHREGMRGLTPNETKHIETHMGEIRGVISGLWKNGGIITQEDYDNQLGAALEAVTIAQKKRDTDDLIDRNLLLEIAKRAGRQQGFDDSAKKRGMSRKIAASMINEGVYPTVQELHEEKVAEVPTGSVREARSVRDKGLGDQERTAPAPKRGVAAVPERVEEAPRLPGREPERYEGEPKDKFEKRHKSWIQRKEKREAYLEEQRKKGKLIVREDLVKKGEFKTEAEKAAEKRAAEQKTEQNEVETQRDNIRQIHEESVRIQELNKKLDIAKKPDIEPTGKVTPAIKVEVLRKKNGLGYSVKERAADVAVELRKADRKINGKNAATYKVRKDPTDPSKWIIARVYTSKPDLTQKIPDRKRKPSATREASTSPIQKRITNQRAKIRQTEDQIDESTSEGKTKGLQKKLNAQIKGLAALQKADRKIQEAMRKPEKALDYVKAAPKEVKGEVEIVKKSTDKAISELDAANRKNMPLAVDFYETRGQERGAKVKEIKGKKGIMAPRRVRRLKAQILAEQAEAKRKGIEDYTNEEIEKMPLRDRAKAVLGPDATASEIDAAVQAAKKVRKDLEKKEKFRPLRNEKGAVVIRRRGNKKKRLTASDLEVLKNYRDAKTRMKKDQDTGRGSTGRKRIAKKQDTRARWMRDIPEGYTRKRWAQLFEEGWDRNQEAYQKEQAEIAEAQLKPVGTVERLPNGSILEFLGPNDKPTIFDDPDVEAVADAIVEDISPKTAEISKKSSEFSPRHILGNQKGGTKVLFPGREDIVRSARQLVDKIVKTANNSVFGITSVTRKFKGWGERVGFAVKKYHSIIEFEQQMQKERIKEFARIFNRHTAGESKQRKKELMAEVVLVAENDAYFNKLSLTDLKTAMQLAEPAMLLRDFFKDAKKWADKRGLEGFDFIENAKKRIQSDIKDAQEKLNQAASDKNAEESTKQQKRIKRFNKYLKTLETQRFMHIPLAAWFPELARKRAGKRLTGKQRAKAGQITEQVQIIKQRRALSVASLLDKNMLEKSDIDPFQMMMSYADRIGQAHGLVNIRDAAVADGLAKKTKGKPKSKDGQFWEKGGDKTIWKGYWIDSRVVDAVTDLQKLSDNKTKFGEIWDRTVAQVKMAQFYNPAFMPMYDLYQSLFKAGNMWRLHRFIPNLAKAGYQVWTKGDQWQIASKLNVFSKPYANPLNTQARTAARIKANRDSTTATIALHMADTVRGLLGFKGRGAPIVSELYNTSWDMAWAGDQMIRLATYMSLKDKGMKHMEAADVAARVHADYADVPAGVRKRLNRIIFTPTYFLSMAKVQVAMVTEAAKSIGHVATLGTKFKQTDTQKTLAMGAFTSAAALLALNEWLKAGDWEEDEWGRKWTKAVDTPQGPEEITLNMTNPLNKNIKYLYWAKALMNPGELDPLNSLWNKMKWEATPVYRIGLQILDNRKGNGRKIRNEFDKGGKQLLDTAAWTLKEVYRMVDYSTGLFPDSSPEMRKALANDVDNTLVILERAGLAFIGSRSSKERRVAAQVRNLTSTFKDNTRREVLDTGTLDEEAYNKRLENYLERVEKLAEEIE
jgi:hypothetical protein